VADSPPPTLAGLIRDARLTREARIMGAHILLLGPGQHEVSTEEWQKILGCTPGGFPKRQRISSWAHALEICGYVQSRPVGRDLRVYTSDAIRMPTRERHIPDDVRAAVFERDGAVCFECGSVDDLTLDHIVPFSHGGEHTVGNLRVLCRRCNSARGAWV